MVARKQWSFKKKNKSLLLLALFFLFLVYFLSISNTANYYFQNEQLSKKLSQAQNAPQKIAILEQQLAYWDQLANNVSDTTNTIQNALFKRVGKACNAHEATLRSLEFSGTEQKESHSIDTYEVVVEGTFKNLVQTVHALEQQLGNGILSSVAYEKVTDRYTKRNYLTAKLYIQSIK